MKGPGIFITQSSAQAKAAVSTNKPFYYTFPAIIRTNCASAGLIHQF